MAANMTSPSNVPSSGRDGPCLAGHTEEGHTTMECLQAAIHMRIGVKDPSWVDGDFRQTLRNNIFYFFFVSVSVKRFVLNGT